MKKIILMLVIALAMIVTAGTASADSLMVFDLTNSIMQFDTGTNIATITEDGTRRSVDGGGNFVPFDPFDPGATEIYGLKSDFTLNYYDGSGPTPEKLALYDGYTAEEGAAGSFEDQFDFTTTLELTQISANNWIATGTVSFVDFAGNEVISANFASTEITKTNGGTELEIKGLISATTPGESILTGDDANGDWIAEAYWETGSEGSDNNLVITDQIRDRLESGFMTAYTFNVWDMSIDEVFGMDADLENAYSGRVNGVITPVPAAMLLGLIGMGIGGWRMRKFA